MRHRIRVDRKLFTANSQTVLSAEPGQRGTVRASRVQCMAGTGTDSDSLSWCR